MLRDGRAVVPARLHELEGVIGADGRLELADDIGRRRMDALVLGDRLIGTEYFTASGVEQGTGSEDCTASVDATRGDAPPAVADDQPE